MCSVFTVSCLNLYVLPVQCFAVWIHYRMIISSYIYIITFVVRTQNSLLASFLNALFIFPSDKFSWITVWLFSLLIHFIMLHSVYLLVISNIFHSFVISAFSIDLVAILNYKTCHWIMWPRMLQAIVTSSACLTIILDHGPLSHGSLSSCFLVLTLTFFHIFVWTDFVFLKNCLQAGNIWLSFWWFLFLALLLGFLLIHPPIMSVIADLMVTT